MMVCSLDSTESYMDGVHLSAIEYEKLANAVVELVAGQLQEGQPAKRARLSTGGQPMAVGVGRGGRGRGGRGRFYNRRGSW